MRLIILLFFASHLTSTSIKDDHEYIFTNSIDHMSMTIHENSHYKLVISSCLFQIKCEGKFKLFNDSLVIIDKRIKENINRGEGDRWKKTDICRKIKKKYLKNFNYMIKTDSALIANEVRWKNIIFEKKQ